MLRAVKSNTFSNQVAAVDQTGIAILMDSRWLYKIPDGLCENDAYTNTLRTSRKHSSHRVNHRVTTALCVYGNPAKRFTALSGVLSITVLSITADSDATRITDRI